MALIEGSAISLMKIRRENLCFYGEWEEPPCHAECLPYRPEHLKETEEPWQWGSRPGFLCTRDDAVMRSRRLEIPQVWEGRRVTGFERFGFLSSSVQELVFPEGLTEIGKEAFLNAVALESLCFPSTLRRIGDHAFAFQERLQDLILPEGVEELGEGAFSCCSSLQWVELPSTLRKIGQDAFAQDGSLLREEPLIFLAPGSWRGSELLRTLTAPLAREAIPYGVDFRD